MSRITIGASVVCLAVALCLAAPCSAQNLQQIDKNSIAVIDSFPGYGGGSDWDATLAIDTTTTGTNDQYVTDYASNGGGTSTFITFDLGQQYMLSAILYTDRTTSGAGNGAFKGGTFDFVTSYSYTFSNDMTFATTVGQPVTVTVTPPNQPTSVDSFQTLSIFSPPIGPVEYIKWQVVTTNGNNPGAADFAFYGQ